ncbi:dTDP-4-dehydrorhamnose reductase [Wielerella bovis]|uniref:dTDP-4-dehydrorhamnose reductase n=1 Tax=Wielerella bovis TaxID=2917790 RepID=UPI002019D73A|nr:dTDP-4-dehydrorhamnose reductase [Wielerella bovis]ULJ63091.1 dTDP-4-dehydrorhamnose reductase [Wielerella bovis]ULJ65321.1 dTDP-4-dehydrorhamnose reductase [Wielerella bovis]ULJ67668.1 dTDP-4-dehydrorhamnose reductase [Wielerella bovis]
MIKYLITGANGQVGSQLVAQLQSKAEILATDRDTLDITDKQAVLQAAQTFHPDFIINAAAHTAVDKAESERNLAHAINCTGAENLALAAQNVGAAILHISTDYVFDGKGETPYRETDPVAPQSVYGETKLAGEIAVQAACERHVILRTAWVFNEQGGNFVKTMLRLGASRDSLGVVADQFGSPTYAGDIAAALIAICEQIHAGKMNAYGVYHFSGSPYVSWHGFAAEIFAQVVAQGVLPKAPVLNEIGTADYPTPASRPANSRLDCGKIQAAFGIAPSDWRKALLNLQDYV